MAKKSKTSAVAREPYLKGKNALYLWSFIGANLAIFLSLLATKQFASSSIDHFWGRVTTKDGMIAASIPILAIILTGVLSDKGKARLVFWRWHNPLPGSRVFTELLNADPRIDLPILKTKLGDLPNDPAAQNALWYHLYRSHRTIPQVSEAHRTYLLTRDITAIATAFVVCFPIGIAAASVGWKTATLYVAALVFQYVLVASAARNYGQRFVLNVLAEESSA